MGLTMAVEGLFTFAWEGDALTAINEAVAGNYTTGRIPVGHSTEDRQCKRPVWE
jgi:hypothetical protein